VTYTPQIISSASAYIHTIDL